MSTPPPSAAIASTWATRIRQKFTDGQFVRAAREERGDVARAMARTVIHRGRTRRGGSPVMKVI